jgi:hypothetical protein
MERTFETPSAVRLSVKLGSGQIEVEPGLEGRTEVEVIPRNRGAREAVDEMIVRGEQRGGRFEITIEEPKRGGFVQSLFNNAEFGVKVRCPNDTAVELQTGSADGVVRGQVASAHAKTGSGDMSFGKTASGDVRVHRVGGDFVANLVSGDLHLSEAEGPVNVSTVSGDQWIGSIARDVRLSSVSGDVHVGVISGLRLWIDATSVSGDMSSELEAAEPPTADGPIVELRAKTVSGDVQIVRA